MGEVEVDVSAESSRRAERGELPKVVISSNSARAFLPEAKPAGEADINEVEVRVGPFRQSLFDGLPIVVFRNSPYLVIATDLLHHVPADTRLRALFRLAGIGTNQDIEPSVSRFEDVHAAAQAVHRK